MIADQSRAALDWPGGIAWSRQVNVRTLKSPRYLATKRERMPRRKLHHLGEDELACVHSDLPGSEVQVVNTWKSYETLEIKAFSRILPQTCRTVVMADVQKLEILCEAVRARMMVTEVRQRPSLADRLLVVKDLILVVTGAPEQQ